MSTIKSIEDISRIKDIEKQEKERIKARLLQKKTAKAILEIIEKKKK